MPKPHETPVASCPKCGAAISDAHPYTWCSKCGEKLPPQVTAKLPKIEAVQAAQAAAIAARADSSLGAIRTSRRIRPFRGLALSGWFIFFAIVDFIAAAIGLLMAFTGSASEQGTGVTLFAVGISGAFLFLALAKVLDYLGEAVFRLRNLEEYATPRPNQAMQRTAPRSDA